jgi:hypothetical protein
VLFTDDKTRCSYLALVRQKSDVPGAYQHFEAWLKAQFGATMKILRSDRGGEYQSEEFSNHLATTGTVQKLTVHDTPEFNSVAKRLNRTLLKRAQEMLHASGLPRFLWGEAVLHACWIKNHTATQALDGMTPYKALHGKKPDILQLREWGCPVWVHNPSGSKLDVRACEGRWVGIDSQSSDGHRIYWPAAQSITVEQSVYFDDVTVPLVVPFEGESEGTLDANKSTPAPETNKSPLTKREGDKTPFPPAEPTKHTRNKVPPPAPTLASTRSRREIRPSCYVQRIEQGEGAASAQKPITVGVPVGVTTAGAMTDKETIDQPGGVDAALAAMGVEGTEPGTIQDARRRADAERWEEAV